MSIASDSASCENLLKPLKLLQQNLITLIETAEKDNQTEMSVKLAHVKAAMEQIREAVNSTPDIKRSADYQHKKIADVNRQIKLKDDFLRGFQKEGVVAPLVPSQRNWSSRDE